MLFMYQIYLQELQKLVLETTRNFQGITIRISAMNQTIKLIVLASLGIVFAKLGQELRGGRRIGPRINDPHVMAREQSRLRAHDIYKNKGRK